jgi:hypothetical protein
MDPRWTVMMTRTRDSGVSIEKGDGLMTATPRTIFRVCFLMKGVVTIKANQGIAALTNKERLE